MEIEKKCTLGEFLLVILCVMATDTISIPIPTNTMSLILLGIFFVYLLILAVKYRKFILSYEMEIYLVVPCLGILLSQIFNFDLSFSYELKIVLLLFGFVIVSQVEYATFKKAYVDIMLALSIVSLVNFITIQSGINWWTFLPLSNNGGFYVFGVGVVPISSYFKLRNFGPFWEPGVFQAYLNIALMFVLFSNTKRKKIKIIILTTTILTTLSTTGYICMVLLFGVWYLRRGFKKPIVLVLFLFIFFFIYFVNAPLYETVFGKFSNGSRSFSTRLTDIKIYLSQWINNPVFGLGVSKSISLAEDSYRNLIDLYTYFGEAYSGTTSTTFRELACFGTIVGSVRLIVEWKYAKKLSKTRVESALFFLFFMILLNTEDYMYSLMFNTLFFYGVMQNPNVTIEEAI